MKKFILCVVIGLSADLLTNYACGQGLLLGDPNAIVYDVDLNSKTNIAVATLGDKIEVWDTNLKTMLRSWPAVDVLNVAVRDKRVAGVSKKGMLYLWDYETGGSIITPVSLTSFALISLVWVDSVSIAAGSTGGELIKYHVTGAGMLDFKSTNGSPVTALTVATGENNIATGDQLGVIKLWDMQGNMIQSAKFHTRWVRELKYDGPKHLIVSGADDGKVVMATARPTLSSISEERRRHWITALDNFSEDAKTPHLLVYAEAGGNVNVITAFGTYIYHGPEMINSVSLITDALPNIKFLIGTHGRGLRLIEGDALKSK